MLGGLLLAVAPLLRVEGEQFRQFWIEDGVLGILAWICVKGVTVAFQQGVLHLFLYPNFLRLTQRRGGAHLCTASVFGLVHLPGLMLVCLTGVAGCFWSWHFRRSFRIAPLVASHMILAVLAQSALPARLNYDLRVGAPAAAFAKRYEPLQNPRLRAAFEWFSSDAYWARCGESERQFVASLYRDLLGRQGDRVEQWTKRLERAARADVVFEFMSSAEFLHGPGMQRLNERGAADSAGTGSDGRGRGQEFGSQR